MFAPINVITVVDVSKALSDKTLENNIYMMDTSWNSTGQGTDKLATACYPGQRINWIIHAIDVQTPALIENIVFIIDEERERSGAFKFSVELTAGGEPHFHYWAGVVPCYLPFGSYSYRLIIQMGKGKASVLYADTPSLNVISP